MIATGPVGWFRTSAWGKTHSASADTIAHGLKNLLGVATEATEAFPPLKSVLGGLRTLTRHMSRCLKVRGLVLRVLQQYSSNLEKLVAIVERLDSLELRRHAVFKSRTLQGSVN